MKSYQKALLLNGKNCTMNLKIPRWLETYSTSKLEIHDFEDSSEQAICVVVYFRILSENNSIVNLV